MSLRAWVALVSCLVACNPSPAASVAPSKESFQFAGLKRSFSLFTPPAAGDSPAPLLAVRKTQSALEQAGHPVSVTVIPGHTHAYSKVAPAVNRSAWEFLKVNRLEAAATAEQG